MTSEGDAFDLRFDGTDVPAIEGEEAADIERPPPRDVGSLIMV